MDDEEQQPPSDRKPVKRSRQCPAATTRAPKRCPGSSGSKSSTANKLHLEIKCPPACGKSQSHACRIAVSGRSALFPSVASVASAPPKFRSPSPMKHPNQKQKPGHAAHGTHATPFSGGAGLKRTWGTGQRWPARSPRRSWCPGARTRRPRGTAPAAPPGTGPGSTGCRPDGSRCRRRPRSQHGSCTCAPTAVRSGLLARRITVQHALPHAGQRRSSAAPPYCVPWLCLGSWAGPDPLRC